MNEITAFSCLEKARAFRASIDKEENAKAMEIATAALAQFDAESESGRTTYRWEWGDVAPSMKYRVTKIIEAQGFVKANGCCEYTVFEIPGWMK